MCTLRKPCWPPFEEDSETVAKDSGATAEGEVIEHLENKIKQDIQIEELKKIRNLHQPVFLGYLSEIFVWDTCGIAHKAMQL